MRCDCEECNGTGKCQECNGRGHIDNGIEWAVLDRRSENYEELKELQKDAKRVISQAAALEKLNPDFRDSYREQLNEALEEINKQAEAIRKKKK